MIECHCISCGKKLETILFSPSKLFIKCPCCGVVHLLKLNEESLVISVKEVKAVPKSKVQLITKT